MKPHAQTMTKSGESGPERQRPLHGFCLDDYRALLDELRGLGYRDVGLDEIDPAEPVMFVRHDVDLCLDRAVRIAEAEAELGLAAHYYILVSARLYNPASAESRRAMRRLLDLGHAIGLHFDASLYEGGGADALEQAAEEECAILERLSGAPVTSISFHRPAPELHGRAGLFAGRAHTYDPRFFHEIGYISDSSGGWYRGHPLDHPSVRALTAIQLLTHPVWWHAPSPRAAEEEIDLLRTERERVIGRGLSDATAKAKALSNGGAG